MFINGTNGNIVTTGVFNANGKAMMDAASGNITSLGTTDTNKLVVRNGAQITNGGLDMTNSKITRVATGTADMDAVNVGQLNNTVNNATQAVQNNVNTLTTTVNTNATTAANATAQVQTNLNVETQARIDGDAATLGAANSYTDREVRAAEGRANAYSDAGDARTLGQAKSYTDQQIGQVRKQVDAVGAVAMAASVVGGVSVEEGKKTAVTAAVGNYGSATAIAVGVTRIIAPNKRLFGTISRASGSKTGVGLGASMSF